MTLSKRLSLMTDGKLKGDGWAKEFKDEKYIWIGVCLKKINNQKRANRTYKIIKEWSKDTEWDNFFAKTQNLTVVLLWY